MMFNVLEADYLSILYVHLDVSLDWWRYLVQNDVHARNNEPNAPSASEVELGAGR
jgi:hypothetical protein